MGGGGGGRLFEAGRLLTFSAFKMGAYSRWALIRGWALIRINTVFGFSDQDDIKDYSIDLVAYILTVKKKKKFSNQLYAAV